MLIQHCEGFQKLHSLRACVHTVCESSRLALQIRIVVWQLFKYLQHYLRSAASSQSLCYCHSNYCCVDATFSHTQRGWVPEQLTYSHNATIRVDYLSTFVPTSILVHRRHLHPPTSLLELHASTHTVHTVLKCYCTSSVLCFVLFYLWLINCPLFPDDCFPCFHIYERYSDKNK